MFSNDYFFLLNINECLTCEDQEIFPLKLCTCNVYQISDVKKSKTNLIIKSVFKYGLKYLIQKTRSLQKIIIITKCLN